MIHWRLVTSAKLVGPTIIGPIVALQCTKELWPHHGRHGWLDCVTPCFLRWSHHEASSTQPASLLLTRLAFPLVPWRPTPMPCIPIHRIITSKLCDMMIQTPITNHAQSHKPWWSFFTNWEYNCCGLECCCTEFLSSLSVNHLGTILYEPNTPHSPSYNNCALYWCRFMLHT